MAWVWLTLGVLYVGVLATRSAPNGWYALAAIPFFLGTLGYFQARERTCVFLAVVGRRNLDDGAEPISDMGELSRVRAEAWRVWLRAAVAALALTVLAFLVPAIAG